MNHVRLLPSALDAGMLKSRKVQRLIFFVGASVILFYFFTLMFPDRSRKISPTDFSGRPPTRFIVNRRQALKLDNVKGFFLQDLKETKEHFDVYHTKDFGLIQQSYSITPGDSVPETQWHEFEAEINRLNREQNARRLAVHAYKVLYLFRSPESWYHAGEEYYGKSKWTCQWTRQDGNGTNEWADAQLTPNGVRLADKIKKLWNKHLGKTNLATPELFLSSPLSRAAETLTNIFDFSEISQPPIFVEYLRDAYGIDTYNSRRSSTYLKEKYPIFEFEDEFAENDELWASNKDEHDESIKHRAKIFLENLFLRRKETYIAIATHEAVIKAMLEATGHRPFEIPVGHMIPMVVKASWGKSYGMRTELEKYKGFYKKDRNCSEIDPVTDPDYEPEIFFDAIELEL